MKQARFWTDHRGGIVKIKIADGQTLSHSFGGPTDEGYSWSGVTYSFDGRTVTCEWATDSRDCDGRMQHHGVAHCDVERLSQGYCDTDAGVIFPAWEHDEQGQRDHSAEAAGY
jgi:hypothetical protein